MSNPAPTLNQINAFNATQGTTIDFNIIGGTEVIRSNKIYIYDLSDNSLICTHLYVSTESIHELPANTDSSIVYESGKSSADFVNGAQYYAQIQTYTDTAGTQGGSGLSVAKMFWCLVDPTLTITTIPSTISTTSYNVSATYTDTSASVVSNIIQQYQFSLYSATGSLLQSSGVVVGSGTQQGTSDAYDISYNFTGLNVGSSYYVTVEVTTTQGMSVSAQSNTFTVSIDTPTLGEATVVNNACDGYISVTSNLSGEYGGSASGEIASFVTDSVNDVSSLKVNLDPVQDLHGYSSPWVGGAGKQLLPNRASYSYNGITYTRNADGSVTVNGTATALSAYNLFQTSDVANLTPSETYHMRLVGYEGTDIRMQAHSNDTWVAETYGTDKSFTIPSDSTTNYVRLRVGQGTTINNVTVYPMVSKTTITEWEPYENLCPITGFTGCDVNVSGKNLYGGTYLNYWYLPLPQGTIVRARSDTTTRIEYCRADKTAIDYWTLQESNGYKKEFTLNEDTTYFRFYHSNSANCQITLVNESWDYEPFGQNYPVSWQTEAGTVYGGTVDLVTGVLTVTGAKDTYDETASIGMDSDLGGYHRFYISNDNIKKYTNYTSHMKANLCPTVNNYVYYGGFDGEMAVTAYSIMGNQGNWLYIISKTISTVADLKTFLTSNPLEVWYELATPQTYQLTPQQIQTLVGVNNVWSEQGDVELSYHIPITNLLVKRQDVADVSGAWLTLYSQPITQASDMDFTFIDFTNQYGKTYKYALVPLLTQTQSGVVVQIEGGYTVSDNVDSIFDGVYIADQTNVERVKAGVGYGNIDMNQGVGSITPIGSKYPIVITNSQNQYHNGSVRGTIVPNDFYSNGNLSRIDMVNKRDELEQFLTNKRAKIIKDWNGNIWLVMIMSNVNCSFDDNYGMGMVSFSADWLEVGDPTNQQDLYNAGLINVGGV